MLSFARTWEAHPLRTKERLLSALAVGASKVESEPLVDFGWTCSRSRATPSMVDSGVRYTSTRAKMHTQEYMYVYLHTCICIVYTVPRTCFASRLFLALVLPYADSTLDGWSLFPSSCCLGALARRITSHFNGSKSEREGSTHALPGQRELLAHKCLAQAGCELGTLWPLFWNLCPITRQPDGANKLARTHSG